MHSAGEEVTSDYLVAATWASAFLGTPNVATVWIPAKDFVSAHRSSTSFSLSREVRKIDGDEVRFGRYGLGFGENIFIDPEWTEFSLPRSLPKEVTAEFTLDGQWDAYVIAPGTFTSRVKNEEFFTNSNDEDSEAITEFLRTHAPTSSTYPGSDEVLSWVSIRNGAGELVGVAALTQWESGGKLLSSVAVHSEMRGAGIGASVVGASVERAKELGIEHLLLAVTRSNESAIRLYEKVGFTRLGQFNHFSR